MMKEDFMSEKIEIVSAQLARQDDGETVIALTTRSEEGIKDIHLSLPNAYRLQKNINHLLTEVRFRPDMDQSL